MTVLRQTFSLGFGFDCFGFDRRGSYSVHRYLLLQSLFESSELFDRGTQGFKDCFQSRWMDPPFLGHVQGCHCL